MKNKEKEPFDVSPPSFGVSAYVGEIEKWRNDLRDIATGALQMQGIEESERYNLKRAINLLCSIDELVKVIGESPYAHAQAHALGQLWGAISAAFIIGSRGIKNPLTQKFLEDRMVRARGGKRTEEGDEIICKEARELYRRNATRVGNESGTAKDILLKVNSERKKRGMEDTTDDAIRRRIDKLSKLGKLAR
jgi:hypothetical protein